MVLDSRGIVLQGTRIALLGGFQITYGDKDLALPPGVEHLIALVALRSRPLTRAYVAGLLWPDMPEDRAAASLRSSLWRLHRSGCHLLDSLGERLRLTPGVTVDVIEAEALARRVIEALPDQQTTEVDWTPLTADLLPDWYDDWAAVERERFRHLRLHALEAICERLTAASDFGRAVDAGLAAVAGEPLRESAQRVLIKAHIGLGNHAAAINQYRAYARVLDEELGIEPSLHMMQLIRSLGISETSRLGR